ncbi:ANTAR domain-containing protein [Arthrobacter sp. Hz1]
MELYRTSPLTLSRSDQTTASALAAETSWAVLRQLLNDSAGTDNGSPPGHAYPTRREIHQATGMVLVQATLSAANALLLLRAHAFANGRTLTETAQDVVTRELDFSSPM